GRANSQIGTVIGQVRVDLFNLTKKLHLAGRRFHLDLHHIHWLLFKDVLLALAAERKYTRTPRNQLPEGAQGIIRAGNIKTDRKTLPETDPAVVIGRDEPQAQ